MSKKPFHSALFGLLALVACSCGDKQADTAIRLDGSGKSPPANLPGQPPLNLPRKRVSSRPANVDGSVFIAEYHHIREGKTTMERSPKKLRKDLERLYELGFRPINVSEFLSGKFDLPPGASPVILTFDDAHPTQIEFDTSGDLDPESGMGVLQAFSKEHPDFPAKAVFFVLPQLWGQPEHRQAKIQWIRQHGGEIASHTMTHPNLAKIDDARVKEELAGAFKLLEPIGGHPEYLALPLGMSPKNKSLLESFELDGKSYRTKAVFLVGANPAPPPRSDKFNARRIPRIQACEGPFGLDDWLDKLEKGQVKPYVAP